jgi:hypothetical protein
MATFHISEQPLLAQVKGGLMYGDDQDILADANLTTIDAAKAAVDAAVLAKHVSERQSAARVKGSLDLIGNFDSTYGTGGDVDKATMLAISTSGRGRSTRL